MRQTPMTYSFGAKIVPISEVPACDETESKRPVVLVVDDEKVIADTLSVILSTSGFSTLVAYDGVSALQTAKAHAPDLLVTDVVMPGMTGVELAIAVTQTLPACKILLFSGQAAMVDLLAEAREAGYDFTTLTKPVHPKDLLAKISTCLGTENLAEQAGARRQA